MLLKSIVKVDRFYDYTKKDGSTVPLYVLMDENGNYTVKPLSDAKNIVAGNRARAVFDFRTYKDKETNKIHEYLVLKSLEGINN